MMTMITKMTMMRSVAIAGDGDNANKCDTLNKSSANGLMMTIMMMTMMRISVMTIILLVMKT